MKKNLAPNQIIISYLDNSAVFHLTEKLNNVLILTYRVLYPNGTNNLVTIYDHPIPSFNFCSRIPSKQLPEGKIIFDQMLFELTIPNHIFVIYSKIAENGIALFGMLIDWSGNIIR